MIVGFRLTDNLPVGTPYLARDGNTTLYDSGYALGMIDHDKSINLHNHLEFTVRYHVADDVFRIVGFEVNPKRLGHLQFICTGINR